MADAQAVYVRLWLDGEELVDADGRVLEVEVEERADDASSCRVSLDLAPTDDEDWDVLADGRWALLHRLSVGFGVGAQGSDIPDVEFAVVFDGYVTAVEPSFAETRVPDSQVEVAATDPMCLLHFEERQREWKDITDADIVRAILGEYGFDVAEVEDTSPSRDLDRATMVQRCTDAQFLRMLARRNGFEIYLEPRGGDVAGGEGVGSGVVAHFHLSRLEPEDAQPALSLVPHDAPTLKTFRARWSSHAATRVRGQHIDERTRRIWTHEQSEPRYRRQGSTSRADVLAERFGRIGGRTGIEAVGLQLAEVPHTRTEVENLAWARYGDADWLAEGTAVVQGQRYPGIVRSRRPVRIEGAGKLLDGAWYVRCARHRFVWDAEQKTYEVDLDLVRNALNGLA